MNTPKINDMQDQRIVQLKIKPDFDHAKRVWDKIRLKVPSDVTTTVLDNYFK